MLKVDRVDLCPINKCTGCMACIQGCPQHAIGIQEVNGFNYPVINQNDCVSCGLCRKVCPVLNELNEVGNRHVNERICIAAWHKDDSVRMHSSSGGAFTALAHRVLSEGGIVYGACWDKSMHLMHKGINDIRDLDSLRRSKYVQSDVGNTFKEVKVNLKNGVKVLFCGTPCQIAGLRFFLGLKENSNLITVDVLCQGVPSPHFFSKYIREIEREKNCRVIDCNFRSKEYGWICGLFLSLSVINKDGTTSVIKRVLNKNSFYNAFYRSYFMRESCYNCSFKDTSQGYYSDITIADFWRIGDKHPFIVNGYEKGISAVLINTEKGRSFFNDCSGELNTEERTWKEFATNGGLRTSKKPVNNDTAYAFLKNHSWAKTQTAFFPVSMHNKFKSIAYIAFGEKHIRALKKLIKGV